LMFLINMHLDVDEMKRFMPNFKKKKKCCLLESKWKIKYDLLPNFNVLYFEQIELQQRYYTKLVTLNHSDFGSSRKQPDLKPI